MKFSLRKLIFCSLWISSLIAVDFAQEQPTKGIELFKTANYVSAIAELKKFVKKNPTSMEANYYIGYSYLRLEKLKDARNFFKKAVAQNPDDFNSNVGLAYVYTLQNKGNEALPIITKAISINPNNAEAYYVLGYAHFRLENFALAIENEDKAISINDKFASAYFVKAQAILNDTKVYPATTLNPLDKKEKSRYQIAIESMNKFLELSPNLMFNSYWVKQKETLQFFGNYYSKKISDEKKQDGVVVTNLKITNQPKPPYTDSARQSGIQGVIRLLVEFRPDGVVGNILVLKSLERSLDNQAISAAAQIQYEPQKENGKTVSAVKVVEYRFTIY
jgi:TonB family protein